MDLLENGASASAQHPEVTRLQNLLKGTSATLYRALQATAATAATARSYVPSTTHVTVHIPVDIMAQSLGRHRTTIWRASNKLRTLGLVDARAHKTFAPGISDKSDDVNDGTLWCVRLNPDEGTPAKLTFEEMKHAGWRDLSGDRKRGRTAHRAVREHREKQMQQSCKPQEGFDIELLLAWALPPEDLETPLSNDCCISSRADFETVLDVRFADKDDRPEAVDGAARALAMGLGDVGGVMFYRWLLWQLLRHAEQQGGDYWHFVYEQARRARTDAQEGFARKPGALFTARLKQAPWWEAVRRQATVRVGPRPMKA